MSTPHKPGLHFKCGAMQPFAPPLHEQIVSIVTDLLLQGNYRDRDHLRYYSLQHYLLNDMLVFLEVPPLVSI